MQPFERLLSGQQASYPCGIAKDLVEGDGDEIGMALAKIQAVGGNKRGAVQHHIPAFLLGLIYPGQWMLHPGEI